MTERDKNPTCPECGKPCFVAVETGEQACSDPTCVNAHGLGFSAGPPFDVGASDDLVIAWVGTATGKGASENLDEKLRTAIEKHRDQWRLIAAPTPYASSMADLAKVGAELFGRLQQIAADIIRDGTWGDQPQHVRDAICILFAMVRNRTGAR